MGKKKKSGKQGAPKSGGRKNDLFAPKRGSDQRSPQAQRNAARGASKPTGHSAKNK